MAQFERRMLAGHRSRAVTRVSPGCVVSLGVAACIIGLMIILAGERSGAPGPRAPTWMFLVLATILLMLAFWLVPAIITSVVREARLRAARAAHPQEPWMADALWNPRFATDDTWLEFGETVRGIVLVLVLLLPFNWWAFIRGGCPKAVVITVAIFNLLLLCGVAKCVYLALRRAKYGGSTLYLERFPFFLGESFDARLSVAGSIGDFQSLRIALRCIEEGNLQDKPDAKRQGNVCFQVYVDERTFDTAGNIDHVTSNLPLSFSLPANAPPTQRNVDPPTYWEVVVNAKKKGLDYEATFVVPVYARPA